MKSKVKAKPVILLTGCLVLGAGIVFVLFALSENKASQRYDFIRTFRQQFIEEDTAINLGYSSYYVAGATADKIYFGNTQVPLHMVVGKKDLKDTSHIRLQIYDSTLRFNSIRVSIDSPYFFILEGTQPYILRGRLEEWYANRFMPDSAWFSLSVPISSASVILRVQSSATGENVLGKIASGKVKLFPGLLEKQFDGVFCVDGMMHYDKELNAVVYVYYYRNQYLVVDTSLNLLYRSHTIDPISQAQIQPDSYSSDEVKTLTMSAPPLVVNKRSCVYGNWLLINSAIHSKAEDEAMVSSASVIDVYDLNSKAYQFSFYLPDKYGNKPDKLWLYSQKLYVMFGNYVVSYNVKI